MQTRTARQPVRTKTVTHVSGMKRDPCDQNGPTADGAPGTIRTSDPQIRSLVLYPAELRALTMSTRGEAFSLKRLQRASLFLDTYAKPLKTKPKRRRTAQFTAQKFHRSPIPLK